MAQPKYYAGAPEKCDICNSPFAKFMYDASIPPGSSWGNVCKTCFTDNGGKLGTGRGQEYTKQHDGKWLKTGG